MPRPTGATGQVLAASISVFFIFWLVLIAIRGLHLASDVLIGPPLEYIWPDIATPEVLTSTALVLLTCLAITVLCQWRMPAATLPVSVATGAFVILAGAIFTGTLGALCFVVAFGLVSALVGWLLMYRLPREHLPALAAAPLTMALGLGIFGLVFFGLGNYGMLSTMPVLAAALAIVVGLLAVQRPRPDLQRLRAWRPPHLTWFESIVLGITVGLIAFASLIALVPETISDPVWQHMPIAREIWQTGSVREFAHLEVSRDPMQAHVLYAVAYGLGGLPSIKLLHALVGIGAIVGVAGLGQILTGRSGALLSAAIFAAMPLTLWLLGHALIDFFTVLLAITAIIGLIQWQHTGDNRWPLVAGVLCGVGMAAKLNMIPLIAVIGAGLFLVGRQPGKWRERIIACAAYGLGTLVALPWILRSVLASGTISPKVQVVMSALEARLRSGVGANVPASPLPAPSDLQVYDPQSFALGQSPAALLEIPWFFTFHADEHRFLVIGRGEIGILLLMLLPLAIVIPRSRNVGLVAVTAIFSYIAWAFSPFQVIRHLLPTFAFAAVLAGAAVGCLLYVPYSRVDRVLGGVIRGGVLVGLAVAPIFFLFGVLTQVPVDYLLGRERAEDYVLRAVPAAAALAASSALPPDTPVAYFGRRDGGAQIYSEARLVYVEPNNTIASLGNSADEVLASLEALGVEHVIWNRPATTTDDWRATALSLPFLAEHTRILAGDRNAYLFEISPSGRTSWTERSRKNLLNDPDLRKVKRGIGPWRTVGTLGGERGMPAIPKDSLIAQRVSVTSGKAYLLVVDASCPDPGGSINLAIRWFDRDDQEIGLDAEPVIPGTAGSEQFMWRRAPEAATAASVELTTSPGGGACPFDVAKLFPQS